MIDPNVRTDIDANKVTFAALSGVVAIALSSVVISIGCGAASSSPEAKAPTPQACQADMRDQRAALARAAISGEWVSANVIVLREEDNTLRGLTAMPRNPASTPDDGKGIEGLIVAKCADEEIYLNVDKAELNLERTQKGGVDTLASAVDYLSSSEASYGTIMGDELDPLATRKLEIDKVQLRYIDPDPRDPSKTAYFVDKLGNSFGRIIEG